MPDTSTTSSNSNGKKLTAKQRRDAEEQEFLNSLPPDRFGVNPQGAHKIPPKGAAKGSKKRAPGF